MTKQVTQLDKRLGRRTLVQNIQMMGRHKLHFPTSLRGESGSVSERAKKWAQRSEWSREPSKQSNERCERTSEQRMWPSTYIPIVGCSKPPCAAQVTCTGDMHRWHAQVTLRLGFTGTSAAKYEYIKCISSIHLYTQCTHTSFQLHATNTLIQKDVLSFLL